MKKIFLLFSFLMVQNICSMAQPCSPDSLNFRSIKAFETDNNIDWEGKNHTIYINSDCTPNNKLLLHLVGTFDNPSNTTYFPILAANNGYKVVSLKYPNNVSGKTVCENSSVLDCHLKYRQEIIFGTDTSMDVMVDNNNCIINRFEKLLIYLDGLYPSENWDDFLMDQDEIDWTNIVVSGHSQGGGHAAFIGKNFNVERVLMFAAPNENSSFFDAPASWINLPSTTPESNYYAFGNLFDEFGFEEQFIIWDAMNLATFGDSINVDNQECPFDQSRILYTQNTSSTGLAPYHNSVVIDNFTPLTTGVPSFTDVWKYMLGICSNTTSISKLNTDHFNIEVYPNPVNHLLKTKSNKSIERIEIINSLGSILNIYEPNQLEFEINMKAYTGFIFIKFYTKNNMYTVRKILVK